MGFTRSNGKFSIVIPIIILLFLFSYLYPDIIAQSNTTFSSKDQFLVPNNNGAINFVTNGSYSNATFESNIWTFENLNINGSTSLQNFSVSAENSNVTIVSYFSSNNATTTLRLRYLVEGNGKQIFNFGLQSHVNGVDWSVIKTVNRRNIFLTPGKDYTISSNGTIVVNGATGNFSIAHYNFSNNSNLLHSNLPFYLQHSVAITTSAVVAIVIVLSTVIAVRNRKYSAVKNLDNGALPKNGKLSTLKDKEKT